MMDGVKQEPAAQRNSAAVAVSVEGLRHRFPLGWGRRRVVAVDGLSFLVEAGTVHGLIGPNGSGKSTTIKCILGLVRAEEGVVRVFGREAAGTRVRGEIGYMPENPYFPRFLTGKELLRFHGHLCGLSYRECEERAEALLKMTGMVEAASRRLSTYSKGMLQRIGLAQALIHEPKLIILDEPTAGLDPQGSHEIREVVLNLRRKGCTVLVTSHLLDQMEGICDAITLLYRGRAIYSGRIDDLLGCERGVRVTFPEGDKRRLEAYEERLRRVFNEPFAVEEVRESLERRFLEIMKLQR
jgi:ABC-2 type transport system ATP-binding protein